MKTTMKTGAPGRIALLAALVAAVGAAVPGVAQESTGSCPADRWEGWLGISGISCSSCRIYTMSATEKDWRFATEPEVTSVDREGPTAGILRPGDLLVAIDGHLITSREGGERFGAVRPGREVTLRFRRDGRVQSAAVNVAGRCLPAELPEAPGVAPLPEIENVLDRLPLPPRAPAARPGLPSPDAPPAPEAPPLSGAGAYLGLSFQCGDCQARVEDGRVVWSFSRPPEITRVDPEGPASQAGLRAGDLIRRVDGSPIESREGGEKFGSIEPGETVLIAVSRPDGSWGNVPVTPGEPAERPSAPRAAVPPSPPSDVVRFTGALGPAQIRVTGGPVSVVTEEGTGVVVIRTRDNEIRIRVPTDEGGGI